MFAFIIFIAMAIFWICCLAATVALIAWTNYCNHPPMYSDSEYFDPQRDEDYELPESKREAFVRNAQNYTIMIIIALVAIINLLVSGFGAYKLLS
jgi:1,4-dihydroxy-2-naphthoate octaprenyltransferase